MGLPRTPKNGEARNKPKMVSASDSDFAAFEEISDHQSPQLRVSQESQEIFDTQSLELRLSQDSQSQKDNENVNLNNEGTVHEETINTSKENEEQVTEMRETELNYLLDEENNIDLDLSNEICPICQEEANLDTIQCDACKQWLHNKCAKLVKKEADMIGKLHGKVKWFCVTCNEKIENLIDEKEIGACSEISSDEESEQERRKTPPESVGESWEECIGKLNQEAKQAFEMHDIRMSKKLEETEEVCTKILDKFKENIDTWKKNIDK